MERRQFDDLTRSMAHGTSRRGVLKALTGGAAGGLAAVLGGPAITSAGNRGNGKGDEKDQGKGKGDDKGGKAKPECCPKDRPRLCGGFTCLACCSDDHCPGDQVCAGGACVAAQPTCTDGIKNGSETDVDCGGGCPGCSVGANCTVGSDCGSGVCRGNLCVAGVCQPGATRTCGSDVGACEFGTETCADDGSGWEPCLGGVGPQPETCNGLDDDCDGVIDGGNPGGGAPCNTGLPGICATGTMVCEGGALVCAQNVQPSQEVCNGLDDDCDGVVDGGACPPMHHATYACGPTDAGLGCVVAACDPDWGNCDGDPANGCETDIRTNPLHCGACQQICPTDPHGTTACTSGACFLACNPGFTLSGGHCVPVTVVGISVVPPSFSVGTSASGSVHLSVPATANTTVNLAIDQPQAAGVPSGVVVPTGQVSAIFPVHGLQASSGSVQLTATLGQSQVTTLFTVV
jgi:hypothetical protein